MDQLKRDKKIYQLQSDTLTTILSLKRCSL